MTWRRNPYAAAFRSRLLQVLQYRTAALAGFATQCWWGGIRVMVLAAFFGGLGAAAAPGLPMSLQQAITYTWLGQGLLALLPWAVDPEVSLAVRTGSVVYDRLRPVDAYALWFARTAGWVAARVLPRAGLMALFAGLLLPLAGWAEWGLQPPASLLAGVGFMLSLLLALALSATVLMVLHIATAAAVNERGVNAVAVPLVVVFSGNLVPLSLLPPGWQAALLWQPLAGVLDIPARIYLGQGGLDGMAAGLALQAGWVALGVMAGRWAMARVLLRLDVQGG